VVALLESLLLGAARRYSGCARCRSPIEEYGEVLPEEWPWPGASVRYRCRACGHTGAVPGQLPAWLLWE
jgi:hypothetical protein